MKQLLAAYLSAVLFGLGLGVAGMTLPQKIIGFLDLGGAWDPSLAVVMLGAVVVHSLSYRLVMKRKTPLLATAFLIPQRRDISAPLVTGAFIFGVGWGLGGFCPGPAIVGLVSGNPAVVTFFISMAAGVYLHRLYEVARTNRKPDAG